MATASTQKIELKFEPHTRRMIDRLTKALEKIQVVNNTFVTASEDDVTHDEETMFKVRMALTNSVWDRPYTTADEFADDIINTLQNAGILFRERKN